MTPIVTQMRYKGYMDKQGNLSNREVETAEVVTLNFRTHEFAWVCILNTTFKMSFFKDYKFALLLPGIILSLSFKMQPLLSFIIYHLSK